ncbi:MAG: hypothetical protein M3N22_00020 [Acidobacteriota bacterium]|nr:hypothetical protein [Acidobacteriota bacterium]
MNELVQILMQKTGLSQDKAQEVVDTVVNHLRARLPGPIASHLDSVLGGDASMGASASAGAGQSAIASIEEKAKSMMAGLGSSFTKKPE